jgi:hypothetical protein
VTKLDKPGPWKWIREKGSPDAKWTCTLESMAPDSECSCFDRMVLPMREDCAQFPYAGDLPCHRLIAASPDLLESLCEMVDMFERHINGQPGPDDAAARYDRARAAIAKATDTPLPPS